MQNGMRRRRRQLSPEEKWQVFLEVTTGQLSQSDCARKWGVDRGGRRWKTPSTPRAPGVTHIVPIPAASDRDGGVDVVAAPCGRRQRFRPPRACRRVLACHCVRAGTARIRAGVLRPGLQRICTGRRACVPKTARGQIEVSWPWSCGRAFRASRSAAREVIPSLGKIR